jgi:hypothetical protein
MKKTGFLILLLIQLSPLVRSQNSIKPVGFTKNLNDTALLETVQRQTLRYFWDFAHPNSAMARERSNTVKAEYYWDFINEGSGEPNLSKHTFGEEACATGSTGFGITAIIAGVNRHWIARDKAVERLTKLVDFLIKADCYHGMYPHFINGYTGKAIPFSRTDDAADIVETSYLLMGLLSAKAYFNADNIEEKYFRMRVQQIWEAANWKFYERSDSKVLYWHWSPNNGFDMNFPIYGWDEALITYIIAASSPTYPISREVYENCWKNKATWKNGKSYYGIKLPLDNYYDKGGPLFFEQYTFIGINPNGLTDNEGIDYFEQGRNHALIQRAYCMENPKGYKGYGENCWGLTAGDSYEGYRAHCPSMDYGVIQPTAALSSFPFTPEYSMQALKHFYFDLGNKLWGEYGFIDGFSESKNWYAKSYIAPDEGPIVGMIENYRSGLLWNLFMNIPDIQNGLKKLGFKSPYYK